MRKALGLFIILFALLLNSTPSLSQPGGDPGGGGNPTVPISGIEILIGAGGLYGVRKLMKKRNPSDN